MPAVDPQSASDVVVFTIGLIALMQAAARLRQREPGMLWFALASLLSTLLLASGAMSIARGAEPSTFALLGMYWVRSLFALGLTDCLGLAASTRRRLIAALVLPEIVVGAALAGGVPSVGLWAALPMLWTDFGLALACLLAALREPGAGHALMAVAPLIGPLDVGLELLRHSGARPGHIFPASVIGFGIIVLVVGLMRRTRDSRLAHAHAERMSNYYAALSHTNQAILRIKEPVALYNEICRICVASAQAKMACVYAAQGDLARRVASAGEAARILEGYPDPWDMTTPEARNSYMVQAILEGKPIVCNDYQNDPRGARWRHNAQANGICAVAFLPLRRDGRTVATLMVAAGEVGIFDEALVRLLGEMTGDISFALDNIDREARHDESVRQVEAGLERFARLFQSAPVAAAIISIGERRVLAVNDAICELHQVPREQMIGRTTQSLAYRAVSADRERFYEVLNRQGRVRNLVVRMTDAQGRGHVELMNAEPIDYLGEPCLIFMSLDITDMRAAEAARQALVEAQAASHAKTQFLSRMSHELRTPLNAVLGFSGLLRHDAADRLTPQQATHLDHVQQAGWHLLRLINDVLDLSRIEAGQFGIELHGVELAPLLDEALQMSQPLASPGGVTLEAGYRDTAPVWALADPTRLRQVVLNLLSNAIKYNRANGSVRIDVARDESLATIAVVDTGLGMNAQQLAHLFEPFNRLGRDRQGFEGTGIGLSLTRELMQLMNGEVAVHSEEGLGTRIVLTLPGADRPPAEPPAAPGAAAEVLAPAPAAGPARGTVLYIEDNAVNTLLVEQLLARWDAVRFVAATDGGTGLRMAMSLRPDLVLLDLQLPDLDGMEVLGRLRAHAALSATPIVVLSASAMPEEIAEARRCGATDYWTKPLDFHRFIAGVAALLPRDPP